MHEKGCKAPRRAIICSLRIVVANEVTKTSSKTLLGNFSFYFSKRFHERERARVAIF